MECLRIKLNSDVKEIITINTEKLLSKIKANLEKWGKAKFNTLGESKYN